MKPKSRIVYAEMVSITILSLMSASLWIEFIKGVMAKFPHGMLFILVAAIAMTCIAILGLHYTFCDIDREEKD